jgi:mono/diheme cytochrome c family protein
MKKQNGYWYVFIVLLIGLLLAGCGGNSQNDNSNIASIDDPVATEDVPVAAQPVEVVGPGEYVFPDEYAEVANPVPADEDSQNKGAGIYEASCERCHGEAGQGDGVSAVQNELEIPAFSDEKIVALSDGELFYILTNGIAETPMEPWDIYNEEIRWHLVNYVRTLQQN